MTRVIDTHQIVAGLRRNKSLGTDACIWTIPWQARYTAVMHKLPATNPSRLGRKALKRFLYSQLAMLDAVKILLGKTEPHVPFTVKADPASVYYNFPIKPAQLEAFGNYLNMPQGFELCPIRCLESDEGDYMLTLNVYEVTGIAVGVRAEWSTYIRDETGCPRYMVVEAQSSEYSMDPIDIITRKGRVEHRTAGGHTETLVASLQKKLFKANFQTDGDTEKASIHPEWVSANDRIYWRNGICDRTFYDAGLAFPSARCIKPSTAQIDDQTHWADFIESTPKHIIQFDQAIDFVIEPWCNLD